MKSRAPKHHNDEELNQLSKEQLIEIIKALQAEVAKSSISKCYDNNLEKTAAMTTDSNIEDYFAQLRATDELADDDEDISPEELAEADAAYQDYLDGRDPGITLEELKLKLFGKKVG